MPSVLIPLAQGCEELEAVTVIDLLRRAKISVTTAGLDDNPVVASRGTKLIPDSTIDREMNNKFDLVVLPGGLPGADNLNKDQRIHSILKRMASEGKLIAAICAAPKVLASAGLLEGKRATCFPGSLSEQQSKGVKLEDSVWVQDGNIITSRGPGTAMDFALRLIELLAGQATRDSVEAPLQRPAAHLSRATG